ncbi:MAG: helicase-associated domain-containing protein [Treponema sp.]|nr:helicase-associated domain-containing protein [Treponema sp.]
MRAENEIAKWQEAIAALSDKQFFDTMRLYLGEIKTPYNKQRLTEQLASFIHKPENIQKALTMMDAFDVKILTAVSILPQVTCELLIDFFAPEYSVTEIYAEVINLTERLFIYKLQDKYSEKVFLYINPFFKDGLKDYLNVKELFPDVSLTHYSTEDIFTLSPNILAAFISYIKVRGISCKADGVIKKNDMNRLLEIFPGKENFIQLLMNAFINLSLVKEGLKAYELDKNRCKSFASLPEIQQYSLLCAASVSRFSKDGLKKEAQLLIDCLSSIPESGYTRQSLLRLAFFIGTYSDDGNSDAKKSRFTRMLEAAHAQMQSAEVSQQNANLLDRMIDSAQEFGLLQKLGETEEGEAVFTKAELGQIFQVPEDQGRDDPSPKVLNLDSTFTVTLMPGLPLSLLLPLSSFMMIKKCGVVTEFEITRQSVSTAFDMGWNPDKIFAAITKYSYYEIPQNLKINISDWYNSYASATLYHGYILKVTDSNITFAENNPNINKYIKEKLAEGIYLLNIPADSSITKFIDESGLDFLGHLKTSDPVSEYTSFPVLRPGHKASIFHDSEDKTYLKTSIQDADKLIKELKQILTKSDMDQHQKESLGHRISSRLILSEEQLLKASVRTEILEADGMDFSGKIHLIEAAIKENDMLEMQFPDSNLPGKFFIIVGQALGISRQPGEAVLRFQVEPTKEIENFLVSRITHLRRIRF